MKFKESIFHLLLLIFVGCFCTSFLLHNYLKDYGLKGKVKRVVCIDYNALLTADGKIKQGTWIDSVIYEFNTDGKLTNSFTYRGQKFAAAKERFEYDKEGHPIFHIKTSLKTIEDSSFYSYKNGLRSEMISFSSTGGTMKGPEKTTYGYKMDQIIQETRVDKKGDTLSQIDFIYNEKGKLISMIESWPNENKKLALQYDEHYSYDQAGHLMEILSKDNSGKSIKTSYSYNDQNDMVTAIVESDYYGLQNTYDYEYDSQNNWIKRYTYFFDERAKDPVGPRKIPQSMTVRKIEYY